MGTNGGPQGRVVDASADAAGRERDPSALAFYMKYRRAFEVGYWVLSYAISALGNTLTAQMDMQRYRLQVAPWEPVTWEVSSHVVGLMLVAVLVWFTRRVPIRLHEWRRWLPIYLAASLVWAMLHVGGMVALRELVYAWHGADYDFGPWLREFAYEYMKDVRTFALSVLLIEGYRLILRRLQGEATLLDASDEPATETANEPACTPPSELPDRFLVRKLGREFLVPAAEIEYAQAASNYVNLRARGRDYPLRSTIASIEQRLDAQRFLRVHRSYIVNLQQIASIESLDTGDARLHLHSGQQIPCSRRYRAALRERVAR